MAFSRGMYGRGRGRRGVPVSVPLEGWEGDDNSSGCGLFIKWGGEGQGLRCITVVMVTVFRMVVMVTVFRLLCMGTRL